MGKRYVEVFEVSWRDMEHAGGGGSPAREPAYLPPKHEDIGDDGVVRLRGLPFEASKGEVTDFFAGVLIVTDFNGRASGEAFVQFTNTADAVSALEKNKASMGRRYIEVFKSSMEEAKRAQGMMMGYGPG